MRPSRSLLMRFLFPVGLLNAPHGDMFLQRSMLRANLETLRRWMPLYVRVHAALAAGLALMLCGVCSCAGPRWLEVSGAVAGGIERLLVVVFGSLALAARLLSPYGY